MERKKEGSEGDLRPWRDEVDTWYKCLLLQTQFPDQWAKLPYSLEKKRAAFDAEGRLLQCSKVS